MKLRAVVFDVDGVLLSIRNSWGYFHEIFGTSREAEENYRLYLEGKITYYEWLVKDVALWINKRGKIHLSELSRIASKLKPSREAYEVFDELRKRGIKTALLSAGINIVVRRLARELGADFWMANTLEFDEEGYLLPEGIPCVPGGRKDLALPFVEESLRVSREYMMFVGDSVWDIAVMKLVACPVLYGDDKNVTAYAKKRVKSLYEIVEIVDCNCCNA